MNSRYKIRIQPVMALAIGLAPLSIGACSSWSEPERWCRADADTNVPPIAVIGSGRFHFGSHRYPVTTQNPAAREHFDRGLTLAYAFSYDASEVEFRKAAALDPQFSMAWWGVAYVNGPHINFPLVPKEKAAVAWDALNRAQENPNGLSEKELALIDALSARYSKVYSDDRLALDEAYAEKMRTLSNRWPGDADIAVLTAEALMDLHPWDLWEPSGSPKEWTPEIIAKIEQALKLAPAHPGANHLYIHAVEASNNPGRAVPAAETLMTLVPGSGHLVHMPSHIFARVGRWEDAKTSNEQAVLADAAFREAYPRPGFYALYMAHTRHFLAFTSMMRGESERALAEARMMVKEMPEQFLQDFGGVADGFMAFEPEVLVRFGRWDEVLQTQEPRKDMPIARAMWRFCRAVALTALERNKEADKERKEFLAAVKRVPKDATFGNNQAHVLLSIASKVLDGEIAAKKGNYDRSISLLRHAAKIEDTIKYDEPPDWIQPVRHSLGAVLLKAGRAEEAEKVYREDLARFPGNGWSLYGLSTAVASQGRSDEAATIKAQLEKEWIDADVKAESSCLCLKHEG